MTPLGKPLMIPTRGWSFYVRRNLASQELARNRLGSCIISYPIIPHMRIYCIGIFGLGRCYCIYCHHSAGSAQAPQAIWCSQAGSMASNTTSGSRLSDPDSEPTGPRYTAFEQRSNEVLVIDEAVEAGNDPAAAGKPAVRAAADQPAEQPSPSTQRHQKVFNKLTGQFAAAFPPKWAQLLKPVLVNGAPGSSECKMQCMNCPKQLSSSNVYNTYDQHRRRCKVLAWLLVLPVLPAVQAVLSMGQIFECRASALQSKSSPAASTRSPSTPLPRPFRSRCVSVLAAFMLKLLPAGLPCQAYTQALVCPYSRPCVRLKEWC